MSKEFSNTNKRKGGSYEDEQHHQSSRRKKETSYDDYSWGAQPKRNNDAAQEEDKSKEPEYKPNFGLSGALAKDEKTGNIKNGVVLKYSEPSEAIMPDKRWRLYVYKGKELVETLHLHRQSSYLLGRDQRVVDIPLAHASSSLQHAVIQYREIEKKVVDDDGFRRKEDVVIPYLMDLKSTHKTYLNGQEIEDSRYYELRSMDLLKFGESTREYVFLNEESGK